MLLVIALSATSAQQNLETDQSPNLIEHGRVEFKWAETTENENLEKLIEEITAQIKFRFDERIAAQEIDAIDNEISKWRKAMTTLEKNIENSDSTSKLPDLIEMFLSMVYVNDDKINNYVRMLKKNQKSLNEGSMPDIATQKWKSYFKDVSDYLKVDEAFYSVLDDTFNALTQYAVQNQKTYQPSNCALPTAGTNVDNSNFKYFVDNMSAFKITGLSAMKNSILSKAQITALNQALNYTLKQKLFMSCGSKVIILKANFIKFSEFLNLDGKMVNCDWRSKTVKIYALNAIFVDRDLNAIGDKLKLNIIAPKWEIIGHRKIILDGAAGESQRAAASGVNGAPGADGKPGNPGGPGGSFFGIGDTFINSSNLTISARGGAGGKGQSGGDGGNGANGIDGFMAFNKGNCDVETTEEIGFTVTRLHSWVEKGHNFTQFKVHGKKGGTGGDGGRCGVGGLGGFHGKVSISTLSKAHGIQIKLGSSTAGTSGGLGKPGMGGLAGSSYLFDCYQIVLHKEIVYRNYMKYYRLHTNTITTTGKAPSSCTTVEPKKQESLDVSSDESAIFTDFTGLLIENMNGRFERRFSKQFLSKLGSSTNVPFDTIGLISHLKMLASLQTKHRKELLPFYDALLNYIKAYASNPKSTERTDEYKKVLNYLYTATLTQISELNNPDTDQIIDITGYFELVSKNVQTLSRFQEEIHLEKVVETLKNDFNGEIGQKIQDAERLIGDTITPEFDKISSQIDAQLSQLVEEAITLQNDSKQQKKELEETKMKLEDAIKQEEAAIKANQKELALAMRKRREELEATRVAQEKALLAKIKAQNEQKKKVKKSIWSKIFGGIAKFVCKGLKFLGPIGSFVGKVLQTGLSVASVFKRSSYKQSYSMYTVDELTRKIENINRELLDLTASIKSRKSEIEDIVKGIDDLDTKFEEYKDFEDKIYEKLIPLLENMASDLMRIAKNLKTQSVVSLDIISWQVQGTLRDIKLEIHLFTKGFLADPYLQRSMEQIEETMTTLIKVYDRIQDYIAQQTLAAYMANLATASSKQIVVSNPELRSNFRELQISIQSNILLSQYSSVVNAFKQWIFPFADVFMKHLEIPKQRINNITDMEKMASVAAANVEVIRSRIHKYKTTIQSFDEHIYLAEFQNSSRAIKPFYVWRNEEHRDMIKRLFSGETVLVKADITRSSSTKDAIKFNLIELGFKSSNQTIQAEINEALMNYAVEMTHLGNSYYRYNDQYYPIVSSSQSMRYSFEKSASGKAAFYNNVYQKMISGDIILSPYMMWRLRLTRNQAYAFNKSNMLANFYDKVDLMLEGHGSFVQTGDTSYDVQSYYKIDKTVINSKN